MIIARGTKKDVLLRLCSGEALGTYFIPKAERISSRKCWIAFTMKAEGVLYMDSGAAKAIVEKGKSLLPIGITKVKGDFGKGACVEFADGSGTVLGRGLVNYSASDVRKIMGVKSLDIEKKLGQKLYDVVIHRDHMAVTGKYG